MIWRDSLPTQAHAGASTEGHKVFTHQGVDVAQPSLRAKLERLRVDRRIGVHQVGRHTDGNLDA